jgi:predicted DsbA family dithiol-disulfide isomerase
MTAPLPIDVVSDVVCPWCYVGKRHLEKAMALRPEIPVELRFRPYFLNPWVPREGMSREEYLIAKFGSVERYNANNQRVADAAAAAGLVYNRDKIKRQPNTLDCHRLILWAGDEGPLMKQRLMTLYFAEGGDLTDREVLVQAASDIGMNPDEIRARLATDQDVARVSAEAEQAKQAGIDGVPCFIFGGLVAVGGAQPPEYLAQALERAASEHERRVVAK